MLNRPFYSEKYVFFSDPVFIESYVKVACVSFHDIDHTHEIE